MMEIREAIKSFVNRLRRPYSAKGGEHMYLSQMLAASDQTKPAEFTLDPNALNDQFVSEYQEALRLKGQSEPDVAEELDNLKKRLEDARFAGKQLKIQITSQSTNTWFE